MKQVHPSSIRFSFDTGFSDDDVADFFTRVQGELLCHPSENDEAEIHAGLMELYVIDVQGAEAIGYEILDLFDETQESFECYSLMHDIESGELQPSFLDNFGDAIGMNILMVHRLEVLPAFRKARLGLAALHRAIQLFGTGCGYAVLAAMPLQFEARDGRDDWYNVMQLARFSEDEAEARRQLQAYYGKLGFRSIAGTAWMALNLDFVRPGLEEIGFEQ